MTKITNQGTIVATKSIPGEKVIKIIAKTKATKLFVKGLFPKILVLMNMAYITTKTKKNPKTGIKKFSQETSKTILQ